MEKVKKGRGLITAVQVLVYLANSNYTPRLTGATIATRCLEITSFELEQNYNNQYLLPVKPDFGGRNLADCA